MKNRNHAPSLLAILLLASCSFGGKPQVEKAGSGTIQVTNAGGSTVEINVKPLAQGQLTSPFGPRRAIPGLVSRNHKGVDYGAPRGTAIFAAADGCVTTRSQQRGYGNLVIIRHADDIETAYAHLDGFASGLDVGSCLSRGQTIGYVGTTGNATGPHLHFEVRLEGRQIDPLDV